MSNQPAVSEVPAEDHYWSEMLKQEVFSFRCPVCNTISVVTQLGDVTQCSCGAFLRVVEK